MARKKKSFTIGGNSSVRPTDLLFSSKKKKKRRKTLFEQKMNIRTEEAAQKFFNTFGMETTKQKKTRIRHEARMAKQAEASKKREWKRKRALKKKQKINKSFYFSSKDRYRQKLMVQAWKNGSTQFKKVMKTGDSRSLDIATRMAKQNPKTAHLVSSMPNLHSDHLDSLCNIRTLKNQKALLKRQDLDFSHFKKMINSTREMEGIQHTLYSHEKMPTKLLKTRDKVGPVATAIAGNKNTSTHQLGKLIKSKDKNVVYALAQNPSLTKEQQLKLFKLNKDDKLLTFLAKNPNVAKEVADKIAKHRDLERKRELAKNCIDPEVLKDLCNKTDLRVRLNLLRNPFISGYLIKQTLKKVLGLKEKEEEKKEAILSAVNHENMNEDDKKEIIEENKELYNEASSEQKKKEEELARIEEKEIAEAKRIDEEMKEASKQKITKDDLIEATSSQNMKIISSTLPQTYSPGYCADCGRPITGKFGAYGDKCRRK